MNSEILKLILRTSFGRNADRPLRAAIIRLSLAVVLSAALGLYLSRALLKVQLATDFPVVFASAFVGWIGFAIAGMFILSLSSAMVKNSGYAQPSLLQQSAIWPLSRRAKWALEAMPMVIAWIILMIGSSWLAVSASRIADQPSWAVLGALYFCSLGAVVIGLFRRPQGIFSKILAYATVAAVGGISLDSAYKTGQANHSIGVLLPIAVLIAIYIWSLRYSFTASPTRAGRVIVKLPEKLLATGWFFLKIVRNRRALSSMLFSLVITSGLAVIVELKHITPTDRSHWLIIGALVSVAYACDIRGLSRRYKALEISGLKDLSYYFRNQLVSAWLVSIVITSPLLIVNLLPGPANWLGILGYYLGLQLFAVATGLLASSFVVPRTGEIGAMFFTAIGANVIFLIPPKSIGLLDKSIIAQIPGWIALACVCCFLIYLIEFQRRKRYGHA